MQMVLSRRGRWEDNTVTVASTAAAMMASRAVTNGAVSLFHSPPAASTHLAASVILAPSCRFGICSRKK
jgi:hypothetical protein